MVKLLFITGAQKTATSSLAAMLNCHPRIFIAFEQLFHRPHVRLSTEFLDRFSEVRGIMRYGAPQNIFYQQLADILHRGGGYDFEFIGDKFPSIDKEIFKEFKGQGLSGPGKIIFTVRDIRTWLCKKAINKWYFTENDVVYLSKDYITLLMKSFLLKDCMRVRMEDFVADNSSTIKQLEGFLEYDLAPQLDRWWERARNFPPENPKSIFYNKRKHPAISVKPVKEDTRVSLKPHPFWDATLPIFDKYFNDPSGSFDHDEIAKDESRLDALRSFAPLKLSELYENYETISFKERKSDSKPISQRLKRKAAHLLRL